MSNDDANTTLIAPQSNAPPSLQSQDSTANGANGGSSTNLTAFAPSQFSFSFNYGNHPNSNNNNSINPNSSSSSANNNGNLANQPSSSGIATSSTTSSSSASAYASALGSNSGSSSGPGTGDDTIMEEKPGFIERLDELNVDLGVSSLMMGMNPGNAGLSGGGISGGGADKEIVEFWGLIERFKGVLDVVVTELKE
ncbi:unnamed protein product [Ambrosiozyma monospora]|uniref:Unnamed protein product n=1 Tax=Ambrosiozyma monospora TaxID=43982 RepID=A0ACB5TSD0_AMBMO|nr:unnamed protein product [Ambrosiozyma monospora]